MLELNKIHNGDAIKVLKSFPDKSIHCCVTSPPYFGLRDYGAAGQIGLEDTPQQYINRLVEVFREIRRVLRDDGTLWLNIGDSYAGSGKGGAMHPENAGSICRNNYLLAEIRSINSLVQGRIWMHKFRRRF